MWVIRSRKSTSSVPSWERRFFWGFDINSCSCPPHLLAHLFHTDPWKVNHDSLPLVLMLLLRGEVSLSAWWTCLYMWCLVTLVTEEFSAVNPKTMFENNMHFRATILWHCFHVLIMEWWLIRPYLTGKFSVFPLTRLCISVEKIGTTSRGLIFPFLNKIMLPMTQNLKERHSGPKLLFVFFLSCDAKLKGTVLQEHNLLQV